MLSCPSPPHLGLPCCTSPGFIQPLLRQLQHIIPSENESNNWNSSAWMRKSTGWRSKPQLPTYIGFSFQRTFKTRKPWFLFIHKHINTKALSSFIQTFSSFRYLFKWPWLVYYFPFFIICSISSWATTRFFPKNNPLLLPKISSRTANQSSNYSVKSSPSIHLTVWKYQIK